MKQAYPRPNRRLIVSTRVGAVALALLPVMATAQPASEESTSEESTSSAAIDDIVVTAQRREESAQSVPISMTALSQATLTQSNITDVKNLQLITPGIQIQPYFVPGNAIFQIRGQANTNTGPTIDPSVGIYFDDVYIARSTGSLVNLVDVSRVEVLKGAQGTLFGKNNAGGVLKLVSNRPTQKLEGYGKAGYESYDRVAVEGVINLPINDIAALRLVGQYNNKSGGYGNNVFTGHAVDWERNYFTRGSLKIEPSSNLSVLIQGDYSDTKGGGVINYLGAFFPTAAGAAFPALETAVELGLWDFNPATQAAAIKAGAAVLVNSITPPTLTVSHDVSPVTATSYSYNPATQQFTFVGGYPDDSNFSKAWGISSHVELAMGFATLKSITAYRKLNYQAVYDLDGSRFHLLESKQDVNQHQFSQEILLNGQTLSDRLNWTVGGIYFNENAYQIDRTVVLAALSALSGGAGTRAHQRGLNKSFGLFAQGTYKLTSSLSLTGGVRWSKDDRTFISNSFDVATNGAQSCIFTAGNGLSTVPEYTPPCTLTQNSSQEQWNYTVAVDYKLALDKLIYLRTSSGYRAGGFNLLVLAPESLGYFKPEKVTDYEIGLKADWLARKLRTNIAVYHSKATDIQNTRSAISATTGAALSFTENRGTRNITGAEFEVLARPSSWLDLNGGLSYIHARMKDPLFPAHTWVVLTPTWAWNGGATFKRNFGNVTARLHGDISYRGKMYDTYDPIQDAAGIEYVTQFNAITLVNARLSLNHSPTGIELAIYGRNLTNNLYPNRQVAAAGLGMSFSTMAEPRVIGFELKVPFGGK